MIQSIKVDIVYYSIGSDFEMEFNLCGCCRMRLLTDKVESQSEFSKSLSRAVKRSRVIILCGPMFGEKGLISTVSKVTGIGTEKLDKTAYELNSDSDIDILKGSTALVTDDGVFGGCIIESSTQSIIILSESKSLRKNIMKQLIYPYITKLSILPTIESEINVATDGEENSDLGQPVEDISDTTVGEGVSSEADVTSADAPEEIAEDNDAIASPAEASDPADDFVIDISNADTVKAVANEGDADDYNSALIFDVGNEENNMSVEERNQKYYLFDDEEEEVTETPGLSIAIKIIIAFIVLIAVLMLYIVVVKPLLLQKDIVSNLKDIFSLSAFIRLP